MSWEEATHAWAEQNGSDDGFYVQVTPPPTHTHLSGGGAFATFASLGL